MGNYTRNLSRLESLDKFNALVVSDANFREDLMSSHLISNQGSSISETPDANNMTVIKFVKTFSGIRPKIIFPR